VAVCKPLKIAHSTLFGLLLIAAHGNAWAEGFFDFYAGIAKNNTADVSVSETTSSGTTSAAASIDLSSSTEFGIRFGVWGDTTYNWVGMGIDLGYLHADGPGVDITAYPFTLLLALRAPLFPTPEIPGGRLQPYAMAGVSFYITDISVQLNGIGGSSNQMSWPWPSTSVDKVYGPYLAAGLAWQPTKSLAIFGEYRYSSFDVDFDTTNSFLFPTANGRVDTTIRSDRILFGISHRFGADTPRKEPNQ
jgi:opacity protein-like surface antigen